MGFFSKDKNTQQDNRPNTVPAEAIWVAHDNEWELGQRDEDGNMIGEWKWWLAPTGHLVCHTFFKDDGSQDMTFTRFHQDGTFSLKGTYKDGVQHGEFISQRSKNETTENFGPRVDCFKAVTTFDEGYVVEEHYFDENGTESHEPYISE